LLRDHQIPSNEINYLAGKPRAGNPIQSRAGVLSSERIHRAGDTRAGNRSLARAEREKPDIFLPTRDQAAFVRSTDRLAFLASGCRRHEGRRGREIDEKSDPA
jgi:hypothetical protein